MNAVTTRRGALLGSAIAGLIAPATAKPRLLLPTAINPDVELIRLCDQVVAVIKERDSLCKADPWAPDRGPLHARCEATWAEQFSAYDQLDDLPLPTTLEGARAMARAALASATKDIEGRWEAKDITEWLALSAAEFLAGDAA